MPVTVSRWPDSFEIGWGILAVACLGIMIRYPSWETIPFHVIWISITLLYGFRVWSLPTTGVVLGFVIIGTGASILSDAFDGLQLWGELFEVPLMSAMFLAMVWHARRRVQMHRTVERLADERAAMLVQEERLLQNVSHELRTPVTIARGHLELLERRLGERTRELVVTLDELTRMERLIDRILMLVRAGRATKVERRPIALVPFLEEVFLRWVDVAPRAWRLGLVIDVILGADETWLRAAIDALVENAVQHTGEYDVIELSAHAAESEVVIVVEDHGHGIPDGALDRIFERFERSDESRSRREGGAGLGLSIAAAIAQAHGGSCSARRGAVVGSIFELRLPFSQATRADSEPAAGATASLVVPGGDLRGA
jgi:signal transduction histidine kinase